jgi:hypothetical protein
VSYGPEGYYVGAEVSGFTQSSDTSLLFKSDNEELKFDYSREYARLFMYGSISSLKVYAEKIHDTNTPENYMKSYGINWMPEVNQYWSLSVAGIEYFENKNSISKTKELVYHYFPFIYMSEKHYEYYDTNPISFDIFRVSFTTQEAFYNMAYMAAVRGLNKNYGICFAHNINGYLLYGSMYYTFEFAEINNFEGRTINKVISNSKDDGSAPMRFGYNASFTKKAYNGKLNINIDFDYNYFDIEGSALKLTESEFKLFGSVSFIYGR